MQADIDRATVAERPLERVSWLLLGLSLWFLLLHGFIPTHRFIDRGDDAFYYFQIAFNHVQHGFWSFDSLHPTNGVQPLWAYILTGVAHLASWMGVEDKHSLARIFVCLSGLLYFASVLVLFRFLRQQATLGMALAVATGLLYPLGLVWNRLWGMETALYGLLLISTCVYLQRVHLQRPSLRTGAMLGLLLGLTMLARLNAGAFALCVGLYCLLLPRSSAPALRFKSTALAACIASLVVAPYFITNLRTTGHLMSISAAVKRIQSEQFLEHHGLESPASPGFGQLLLERNKRPLREWLTQRSLDGMWIAGSRLVFGIKGSIGLRPFLLTWAILLGVPLLFGARAWLVFLRARLRMLASFAPLFAFAVLDACLVVWLYPNQLRYAARSWWLVEVDLIVVLVSAAVVSSALVFCCSRLMAERLYTGLACALLIVLALVQVERAASSWFRNGVTRYDWNRSWNHQSHAAALWFNENVPRHALVGSWNAGVLGYYAEQRVINLDGLINSFELLPYLRERRLEDYIREQRISYLADMDAMLDKYELRDKLNLEEVYSRWTPAMGADYKIYRVLHVSE